MTVDRMDTYNEYSYKRIEGRPEKLSVSFIFDWLGKTWGEIVYGSQKDSYSAKKFIYLRLAFNILG